MPFQDLLASLVSWIPALIRAIVVFIIGWIVASVIKSIIIGILRKTGLDRRMSDLPEESYARRIFPRPSQAIGNFVYWILIIITLVLVIGVLNVPILTMLSSGIIAYIPKIIAALIIFFIALAISALVSGMILRWMGDTPTGKIVAAIIPIIILSIAGFAILEQLRIAPFVVAVTYIALIGSLFLALALAFGLGGRDVASRILEQAYDKASRGIEQARRDMMRGRTRAEEDIETAKERIQRER